MALLPAPVTSSLSRSGRDKKWENGDVSPTSWRPRLSSQPGHAYHGETAFSPAFLRSRARTTNLAVLLLAACAAISLLLNVRLYFGSSGSHGQVPLALQRTIPSFRSSLKNLVMVPGHAIWKGNAQSVSEALDDSEWVLFEMQKGGPVKTFINHITKGVELVAQDPEALLVFSGGQTRSQVQASEGQSYLRYAEAAQLFQQYLPTEAPSDRPFARATTEDFALDSYENLLFSLARFREVTGHYPDHITVVGFGMKRKRFEDVHRAALRWPRERFTYIGIDNDNETGAGYSGELQFGLQPFLADKYGCHSELLAKKRGRNAYKYVVIESTSPTYELSTSRFHPYFTSAPELADLLAHCPSQLTKAFEGRLPWLAGKVLAH